MPNSKNTDKESFEVSFNEYERSVSYDNARCGNRIVNNFNNFNNKGDMSADSANNNSSISGNNGNIANSNSGANTCKNGASNIGDTDINSGGKGNNGANIGNNGNAGNNNGNRKKAFFCKAAPHCGACQFINEDYETQLASKEATIRNLFGELVKPDCIRAILAMAQPYRYRNKVVAPFAPATHHDGAAANGQLLQPIAPITRVNHHDGAAANGQRRTRCSAGVLSKVRKPPLRQDFIYGMYAAGTHRIVQTDDCLLENESARCVIAAVAQLMRRYRIAPYDEDTATGFMRYAQVRVGHTSGEVLLTLVTFGERFTGSRNFCRELLKQCPFVTTVVQNINTSRGNVILGEKEKVLYGPGFILDKLCGLSFRISSKSFYQVNAFQTERLYRCAVELAHLEPGQRVLDAYCGTGTIGLVAAHLSGASLVGVDSERSSIQDARNNARHNGIDARFVVADAADFLQEEARAGAHYDVAFLDPPRSGCSLEFCRALIALAPSRIVYISCNPVTQLRDLRVFVDGGYSVDVLVPVDMFPHTPHVECVVLMSRTGA